MGLKDMLRAKMTEMAAPGGAFDKAIDQTLQMKVDKLRKEGKPVTKENLMSKWEKLKPLGVTEEMVSQKVDAILKDIDNAD